MNLILLRLTRRYVDRRLLQSLLFVAGIALGVAVGVAIDLANGAASRAFSLSVESVTGRTTHQIAGSSGSVRATGGRNQPVRFARWAGRWAPSAARSKKRWVG